MRIISGTARGRKLFTPADEVKIRPTTDRVKEAIFDIVQFDVEGRRVLDLFAGTGQLGIEALSRGAANVAFVDESSDAVRLVRSNLEKCASAFDPAQYYVYQSDALTFLKRREKYDLILLDPPYMTNLLKKSVETIISVDKLNFGGIIVCESSQPQEDVAGYARKLYRYGKTYVTVLTKLEPEPTTGDAAQ